MEQDAAREQLRVFVEATAKALVDKPDELKVGIRVGEQTTVFEINAAKSSLGQLIGKQGRNITAIRTLSQALSAKLRLRAVIDLIEER